MELDWITTQQAAQCWNISERRVQSLCAKGRITGVKKLGRAWLIPKGMSKPIDGTTIAAKITRIEK